MGIHTGSPSWLSRSTAYGTSRRRERFLPDVESSILQTAPFVPGVKKRILVTQHGAKKYRRKWRRVTPETADDWRNQNSTARLRSKWYNFRVLKFELQ